MKLVRPSIAQLVSYDGQVLNLTDHGREPVSIDYQLIENSQRMADGRMRKYVIASKKTITFTWSMIPSLSNIIKVSSFRQIRAVRRVDGIASIETLTSHGYSAGEIVRVLSCPKQEYNGTYKISAVASPTAFSFEQKKLGRDVGSKPVLPIDGTSRSISLFKRIDNVVTLTTSSPHGYADDDIVDIIFTEKSNKQYGLNEILGGYKIKNVTATTFSFDSPGEDIYEVTGVEEPKTGIEIVKMRKRTAADGKEYLYLESKEDLIKGSNDPTKYSVDSYVKISNMKNYNRSNYNGIFKITGFGFNKNREFACRFYSINNTADTPDWMTSLGGQGSIVTSVTQGSVAVEGTSQKFSDPTDPYINIFSGQTHIETFREATVDGFSGAANIKDFYETNIYRPVTINLFYSDVDLPTEDSRMTPRIFGGTEYQISSRSRSDGVSSITINRNHNLKVGDIVEIVHLTPTNISFNGKHVISKIISPTSFQYNQQLKPDVTNTSTVDGYIKTITQTPTESISAFMTSFNFTVVKRLDDMDYWDVSLTLEEV